MIVLSIVLENYVNDSSQLPIIGEKNINHQTERYDAIVASQPSIYPFY